MRKIGIFGAGAVGSVLAARLAQAGLSVSLIGRDQHVHAMRQGGLHLQAPEGHVQVAVNAFTSAQEAALAVGSVDVLLVTLKAHSLPAAAQDIAYLAKDAPVVFVVNGIPWWYAQQLGVDGAVLLEQLDAGAGLRCMLKPSQVFGGVVRMPSQLLAPGYVRLNSKLSGLTIGLPEGGISDVLVMMQTLLHSELLPVRYSQNLKEDIWQKLLVNLPSSLLSTLSMAPSREVLRMPVLEKLYRSVVQEGLAVAQAYGVRPSIDIDVQIEQGRSVTHPPSMLQDLLAGRPLEIVAQLEAVQILGQQRQVPMPNVESLLALLQLRSRTAL